MMLTPNDISVCPKCLEICFGHGGICYKSIFKIIDNQNIVFREII